MTPLEEQVLNAIKGVEGWCSDTKAIELCRLVKASKPSIVVEVGVFGGKSLIPMALACRDNGFGGVIGVDPWQASESVKGQTPEHEAWWRAVDHEKVYKNCITKLTELGLEKWVQLQRTTSDRFVPPKEIQILSVDGNHGQQVISDVLKYAPLIPSGGHIIMDDLAWPGFAVSKAVMLLTGMGFQWKSKFKTDEDDWCIMVKNR
jgi:cephalosporin hydroxylase